MFPTEYLFLLTIQFFALLIIFTIFRIIAKFKMLKAISVSVAITALLSTLLLCFDIRDIVFISKADIQEYVVGSIIIALPFGFILIWPEVVEILKKSKALKKWIYVNDFSSQEKSRILKMIEDNKITAAEGSELLDAIGRSSALRGEEKFSRVDILMLVGVSIVVLGFFMPWVRINLKEIQPQILETIFGVSVPDYQSDYQIVYQAGYQAGALGWAVFIIALLSVVPIFVTPQNLLYKISMLQIFLTIIGAVMVFSILIRTGGSLGIGLLICLMGFVVGIIASVVKFKQLAV